MDESSSPEYKINLNFPPSTAPNIFVNATDHSTGISINNYNFHVGYTPQYFPTMFPHTSHATTTTAAAGTTAPGIIGSQPSLFAPGFANTSAFQHPAFYHPTHLFANHAGSTKGTVETCLRCEKWKRRLQKFGRMFRLVCQMVMIISGLGSVYSPFE
jgi:hypothetical protein